MRARAMGVMLCAMSLCMSASVRAAGYTYTILNVQLPSVHEPLSACEALGINDLGVVVGECGTSTNAVAWSWDGKKYGQLEVRRTNAGTQSVNNSGHMVGMYWDKMPDVTSFLRKNGAVATVSVPGSRHTEAYGMNDFDDIVGDYNEAQSWHGFMRDKNGYRAIDVPGAVNTQPNDINNYGIVAGCYEHCTHGFVLDSSVGTFEAVDIAGAVATVVFGVNNLNEIVGVYANAGEYASHGFVRGEGGVSSIDLPGATSTVAAAMNNKGTVAGYALVSGKWLAFVASK